MMHVRVCCGWTCMLRSWACKYSQRVVHDMAMPCICVPKLLSKEALLILIQGAFLVSRTFLTDRISRIEARAGRHLISQVLRMYLMT